MRLLKLPLDVIVLPENNDHWIIYNVFAKTCLGVDSNSLAILMAAEKLSHDVLLEKFQDIKYSIWDVEWFSNEKGLLADPTRYLRNVNEWPSPRILSVNELVEEFCKHFLLLEDEEKYKMKFSGKKSLLDREHFGNFHEQLGQHLMLIRRESPSKWWTLQKFNEDLLSVRNNLYHAVQVHYLEGYFSKKFLGGERVVDIGCGIGFYSNMMAKNGASVLGIDPNEEYVNLAKKNAVKNSVFERMEIGTKGALDGIPTGSADYVFMSDALLFYFVPVIQNQKAELKILFDDIKRILKPNGKFISMEPHYIFWLLPWLGEKNRPFTIITEYAQKTFGVTPTISQLIQAYARGGFTVTWMEEILPDPSFELIDLRSYNFANQFPLWQIFELMTMKIEK